MITRVYRYGLLPPIELADEVRRQISAAHTYRNKLVEIERARRAEMRALLAKHGDVAALTTEAQKAEAAIQEVVTARKAARARERSYKPDASSRDQLKTVRAAKREVLARLREARRVLREDEAVIAARDAIEDKYSAQRRAARAECATYWGTYLLIEAADQAARKAPLYDGAEPNDPRFVRWSGDGQLGVQVQQGAPIDEARTLIRIEAGALPKGADPNSKRSLRRKYAVLAMRVGSNEDRSPVWARWPMVMHRPLPPGAIVKRATVTLTKIGPRESWNVCITVQMDPALRARDSSGPRVAVDIGWRLCDEGLRVATWRGEDGESGFLVLDKKTLGRFTKADDLRAIRDKNFNGARDALIAAIPVGTALPEWWPTNLGQWRSQARLGALVRRWADQRFEGDEAAYEGAEAWRYHDYHLWEWETSQRRKTLNYRREVYRIFAAEMAKKYGRLVIEDFDLRDVARVPDAADNVTARYMRTVASTSELRRCMTHAFGESCVDAVPAEYTTKRCAECGSIEQWDQAADVVHTCGACGVTWDQDENAAKNLLAYRPSPEAPKVEAAVDESKWDRARRMAEEKKARKKARRTGVSEAADNAAE